MSNKKQEKQRPLYLEERILRNIEIGNLPAKWQGFDFARFSKDKTLFDFQKHALQNALKGLWLYFKDKKTDKQSFFNLYQANDFTEEFDYDVKKREGKKTAKYLLENEKDYLAGHNGVKSLYFAFYILFVNLFSACLYTSLSFELFLIFSLKRLRK